MSSHSSRGGGCLYHQCISTTVASQLRYAKSCLGKRTTSQPYTAVEHCDNLLPLHWAWKVLCPYNMPVGFMWKPQLKEFGAPNNGFPEVRHIPLPTRLLTLATLLNRSLPSPHPLPRLLSHVPSLNSMN